MGGESILWLVMGKEKTGKGRERGKENGKTQVMSLRCCKMVIMGERGRGRVRSGKVRMSRY